MEILVLDSISHEWQGEGGCLQIHEQLGGRFQDWASVKPRHQKFIDAILQSKCHIITTTRRKTDYSMDVGSNGKSKVVKHGTKEITSDGFEYELSVNFELINENHLCKVSKDRTNLFQGKPEFIITSDTGKQLKAWCHQGVSLEDIKQEIASTTKVEGLRQLGDYTINQEQFAHLVGKMKLYNHLDKGEKQNLFDLQTTDSQINTIIKNYVGDEHFRADNNGYINLWNLYNLFTESSKSNYIDNFLSRNCNTYEFVNHLGNSIKNQEDNYFLNKYDV